MPYAIQTKDKPDHGQVRADVRAEHVAWLDANKDKLLAAGALIDDGGGGGHGGILIVDVDDRAAAEAFIAEDPFTKAGLFESVSVTRWRKAFFNFENYL
jgi:uncharacterized protein YciI